MSTHDKNGLGFGKREWMDLSNKSKTDSENSLTAIEVRSSDEESTLANNRFTKATKYHVVSPPITGNPLTFRADISFTGLDEYAFRNKIIESKTTETNKTLGTTNEATIVKPKSVNEKHLFTGHLIKDCDFYKSPELKVKNGQYWGEGSQTSMGLWQKVVSKGKVENVLKLNGYVDPKWISKSILTGIPRDTNSLTFVPGNQRSCFGSLQKDKDLSGIHTTSLQLVGQGFQQKDVAAHATSTNQLSTDRPFVNTDRPFVSTDRSFVSIDRSNTPNVSAVCYFNSANADKSSFVYLGGEIPIDASTLPNVDLPIDPNMPNLEDASNTLPNDGILNRAYDDDKDDHPKGQILGDPTSAVKQEGRFKRFFSPTMPYSLVLVDLPFGKKAIGTKWVFRNKRDERSIVVKNKARLVAQGHRQEEGIDYDEVFAPVARIEAIRLFLAFASYMGFLVYQMDVKSAFLYGTINEEVYVHQPLGFVDPAHLNKVYKVVKALYGLHQALETWLRHSLLSCWRMVLDREVMHKRFEMSSMGELTFFLGLRVKQQPDGIFISQDKISMDLRMDRCSPGKYYSSMVFNSGSLQVNSGRLLVNSVDFKLILLMVVDFLKGTSLSIYRHSKEYNITDGHLLEVKLQLADAIGIHNLSDAEIYVRLATLGYVTEGDIVPLLPAMLAGAAWVEVTAQQNQSYEAPLPEGNTSGSAEDSMQLKELMVLKVKSLETALREIQGKFSYLISEVDHEEKSTDFVTPTKASGEAQEEYQRRASSMAKKINTRLDAEEEINTGREKINTGREEINTGIEEVSTRSTNVDSGAASKRGQREGKAPMVEEDIQVTHKTKEQMRQEEAGLEEAIKLQAYWMKKLQKQIYLDIECLEYAIDKRCVGKDYHDQGEKVAKVKEEEPVKRTGKRKKQKARKAMVKDFTREDLIELYSLVMQKYGTNRHEDAYDRVLWSDLRTMFDPPLNEDAIGAYN
ncbi:putative ribonuclease H-like domain-containing protein [Tanacetum coccineum]